MSRLAIPLLCALLITTPGARAADLATPQVIGGSAVPNGMFPFVVALMNGNNVICSASLIRPNWILTAAHCGEPTDVLISDARPGARGAVHDVWAIPVESWTPHPQYNASVFPYANDIALVKIVSSALDFPPTLNDVPLYHPATIPLASGPSSTASSIGDVLLAGFGFTDPSEAGPPPGTAHWADGVGTTGASSCDISGVNASRQLCYGPSPNSCTGDSGGPLFRYGGSGGFELVGLVSVGLEGSPCATFEDVGTYVPGYLEWIDDTISPAGSSPISLGWELPPEKADGVATGIANGQGWTYSAAGDIVSVELFVDGKKEATLPCCSERGDAPGPLLSGFAGAISWGRFTPGDHTARLVVTDSAGNERSETRTITTVRSLDAFPFAVDLSFDDATCNETGGELRCTDVSFAQASCTGQMRFRWLNGKQALEVVRGCPD